MTWEKTFHSQQNQTQNAKKNEKSLPLMLKINFSKVYYYTSLSQKSKQLPLAVPVCLLNHMTEAEGNKANSDCSSYGPDKSAAGIKEAPGNQLFK